MRARGRLGHRDDTASRYQRVLASISIIIPVYGIDFEAERNFRSWLRQRYPAPFEVVFALQTHDDPVLDIITQLKHDFPGRTTISVEPLKPGLNAKASNMLHGVRRARYQTLVFADSDIRAPHGALLALAMGLSQPDVGVTAALPIARAADFGWGRLNALLINTVLGIMWAPLAAAGLSLGIPGATFAVRRHVLEQIGGVEAFGAFVAEDLRLGQLVCNAGYRVAIGPTVDLHIGRGSFGAVWGLLRRGGVMMRAMMTPVAAFLNYTVNGAPWVFLVMGPIFGHRALLMAGWLFALRCTTATVYQVTADPRGIGNVLTYPALEVLSLLGYAVAYTSSTLSWRGVKYDVEPGGKLVPREETTKSD